ncbi:hypothetical protein SGLAM104S_00300 [Streptomyces glaucescens]
MRAYHQGRWILSTIRELNERSRTGGGNGLRLVDWEGATERLRELHRLYVKLEAVDRDQAEVLKELRLAAILLEFSKTDVRHMDEDFLKAGLEQQLPMGGTTAAQPQSVSIPGLGLEVPAASSAVAEARAMNDEILRTAAVVRNGASDLGDERRAAAQDTWDSAKKAFDEAIGGPRRPAAQAQAARPGPAGGSLREHRPVRERPGAGTYLPQPGRGSVR